MMTLSQISDKLFETPGVHEAFVHQVESLAEYRSTRVAGGGWNHAHQRGRHFRVGITSSKGKFGESEKPTVKEAIEDAFARAAMPVPPWVEETKSYERGAKSWGRPNQ